MTTIVFTDDFTSDSDQEIEDYGDYEYVDNDLSDDIRVLAASDDLTGKNDYDTVVQYTGAGTFRPAQFAKLERNVIGTNEYSGGAVRCGGADSAEYYAFTVDNNEFYLIRGDGTAGNLTILDSGAGSRGDGVAAE